MTSEAQKKRGYPLPEPITGNPLTCLSMMIPDHPDYRAAVRGTITSLGKWWVWQKGYQGDTRATQVAQVMRELIHETLTINDECFPDDSGCLEYHNLSYIIEYHPNYPTDQTTPPGYLFPPWYIAPEINLIGAPAGAVVTDIARFPYVPGQPPETLPRFRVHLNGTGSVELHLIAINFGGNAIIQVDGDILQTEVVDLNQDIIAVPPETEDVIVIEREITTPGTHFIDVTMTPVLQNEIPPVLFGGGLLKIVLCGFDDMAREIEIQLVPAGEGCQQFQKKYTDETEWTNFGDPICDGTDGVDGREVEIGMNPVSALCQQPRWRYVGETEWTDFGDLVCSGQDGEDGADGVCLDCPEVEPPEPPEGQDGACQVATAVTNWIIGRYTDILSAYIEDVIGNGMELQEFSDNALGLLNLGNPLIAVSNFFLWIASQQAQGALDNLECAQDAGTVETVMCALYCLLPENGDLTAAIYSEWMTDINADTSTACRADLTAFMASLPIAEIRTEAVAAVVFNVEADCDACDCEAGYCSFMNFQQATHGWVARDGTDGVWNVGSGWEAVYQSTGSIKFLVMSKTFTDTPINTIAWQRTVLAGTCSESCFERIIGYHNGGEVYNYQQPSYEGNFLDYSLEPNGIVMDKLEYTLIVGNRTGNGNNPGGLGIIQFIEICGDDPIPPEFPEEE